jgi:twitching motility protein PilT
VHTLLSAMRRLGASDLHLKPGLAPTYRIEGRLRQGATRALEPAELDALLTDLTPPAARARLESLGSADFAFVGPDHDRFRVNVFRTGGSLGAVIRRVRSEIPSRADLRLPPILDGLIDRADDGLILITGATRSGKSSTLAALLERINATRAEHIITIEDPVEFRLVSRQSIVSQREVGIDVPDFASALRAVVREDPDVILIGELRDRESVLAAIQAAETGHLVLASLHVLDASSAVPRMLEFFPASEQAFIRRSLALTLRALVAQKLLRDVKGALVPACEVLIATPIVRDRIARGHENELHSVMAQREEGMQTFTQALADLVTAGTVAPPEALAHAPHPEALQSLLAGLHVREATLIHRRRDEH